MKAFTMLQKPVDVFVDEGRERSGQNTSESQRAMPKFTSALKPADKAAGRQCLARICDKGFIASKKTADELAVVQLGLDLRIGEFGTYSGVQKARFRLRKRIKPSASQRCTNAEAFASGRRRNKYVI